MEINMIQRHTLLSRPAVAVPLSREACRTEAIAASRTALVLRTLARAGISFLHWLSRLGTGRIDVETLERSRAQHTATLRIRSIGH